MVYPKFLIDHATEKPPEGTDDDARTARIVHNDFEPVRDFLKKVLALAPKP